jgi:hypothetical protein
MFGANWKTTLAGWVAGATQVAGTLAQSGFHLGHFGGTDWLHLFAGVGMVALGSYAKDSNVTGGSKPNDK